MGGNDTPPLCECHGVPKFWHKDARQSSKGYWLCAVKRLDHNKKYNQSEQRRASRKQYENTEKGRKNRRKRDERRKTKLLKAGICTRCAKRPLATADGWNCNECLDSRVTPEKLLKNRRRLALARKQKREANRGTVSQQE